MNWFSFHPRDFAFAFLGILFESIPFLLLGALASGVIEAFVPARWMTRVLPRHPALAVLVSGLLGGVFPLCECGVVPVIRRLMQKGLPVSCAVTYLLAAPVINPITVLSTFAAFNGQRPAAMVAARLLVSFAAAVLTGLAVHRLRPGAFLQPRVVAALPGQPGRRTAFRLAPRPLVAAGAGGVGGAGISRAPGPAAGEGGPPGWADLERLEAELRPSLRRKLSLALQRGAGDFLDVAVFVVIGAALASLFNTAVDQTLIVPLAANPWSAVGVMLALAFFVAVCSTSDAFIAATLTLFPFSARLAFLTFGPVFDLKLVFLYSLVFRRRFILLLAVGLALGIGLVCVALTPLLG